MRLLIATQHFGIVGGVETYLRAVLPRLVARGFEVAVLAEVGDPTGGIMADCPGVPVWTTKNKSVSEIITVVGRWGAEVGLRPRASFGKPRSLRSLNDSRPCSSSTTTMAPVSAVQSAMPDRCTRRANECLAPSVLHCISPAGAGGAIHSSRSSCTAPNAAVIELSVTIGLSWRPVAT